ncbi:hypothetical protein ACFFTM_01695 [Pseudoduganella plicata]|uniref:Lipocalin-like domain-containing protein n=1 Tax=Pseudoduganella plicata TaxID=321984 RepID=A0A4P7BGX5_9BURK|nr:hypothetical protein [Pseudoduganella plicata]QBQ36729.1 hypothetical protein E1742_11545 [Pseudoduganella plicata]GGY73197.1 hypothetical protein GCM10007388_01590 [Pseudoduganella plicata]
MALIKYTYKRHSTAIFAAIVILASFFSTCQAVEANFLVGEWRLVKVLDSVAITALDDKAARALLGQSIRIRPDGAIFGKEKCQPTELEALDVEPNIYLASEAGIDNSKLKLPNPVTVFDISCATVFVKNRNRMVVTWGGYFFDAVRAHR